MKRVVLALALTLAVTGCARPRPATAPAPAADPNAIECVNVQRAHNTWVGVQRTSRLGGNVGPLGNIHGERLLDAGKEYLTDATGYNDTPSKTLAAAIAEYNFAVALANATATADGVFNDGEVTDVAVAEQGVRTRFAAFIKANCADAA